MTGKNLQRIGAIRRHAGFWLLAAAAITSLLGFKYHQMEDVRHEVHATLASVCAADANCLAALDSNYDSCFESAWLAQRRGAKFDNDSLITCLNETGATDFVVAWK